MLNPEGVVAAQGGPSTGPALKKKKKFTPDYFHVLDDKRLRANVYEPEADSFLLLDALDAECDDLRSRFKGKSELSILEIGPGSGVALTHLSAHVLPGALFPQHEGHPPAEAHCINLHAVGVDLNPIALEATQQTWDRTFEAISKPDSGMTIPPSYLAEKSLSLLNGDLFSPFMQQAAAPSGGERKEDLQFLGKKFDVILFNPPYVPTTQEELDRASTGGGDGSDWLEAAWSGGPDGRVVVDRFLEQLEDRLLEPHGVAYVVALEENIISTMQAQTLARRAKRIASKTGGEGEQLAPEKPPLQVDVVAMRYTGEKLRVVRFTRPTMTPQDETVAE